MARSMAGQNVWQTLGGMEVGSVWGHGSYVAPDWTADWLHREAMFILDQWAGAEFETDYAGLSTERQGQLVGRLTEQLRSNRYDSATGTLTITPHRGAAFDANVEHYVTVFMGGSPQFAIPADSITDVERVRKLSAFFFWSSWSAVHPSS